MIIIIIVIIKIVINIITNVIIIIIIAPAGFLAPEGQKPEEAP